MGISSLFELMPLLNSVKIKSSNPYKIIRQHNR